MIRTVEKIAPGVYVYTYGEEVVARIAARVTIVCEECESKLWEGCIAKPEKEDVPEITIPLTPSCKCYNKQAREKYENKQLDEYR